MADGPAKINLAEYLPYLVNRVGQRFAAAFSSTLSAEGQDIQSWRVLSVLAQHGVTTVGALSDLTSINFSTLSRLLTRMAARELVIRKQDPGDARSVVVELTAGGAAIYEKLLPAAMALENDALRNLSADEAALLRRSLTRLHDGFAGPDTPDENLRAAGTLTVASRYCGPSTSGHGGYTAGHLARRIEGPAEVTLRSPIPMDRPLDVTRNGDEVGLFDGEDEIASAVPGTVALDPIAPPTLDEAAAGEEHFVARDKHLYPHCFVCGIDRAAGDGLRVFSGILPGRDYACARWFPGRELAREDGKIDDPFVWALLDCPAYFGMNLGDVFVLTGRMAVEILDRPWADEPYIVAGWKTGREGRKHFAGSAIFDTRGNVMAKSTSIWIEPRR